MNTIGISLEREIHSSFENTIDTVTEALKTEGFGVLTRIDFDEKIKEKLGHTLPRTAILGACNPKFAYEAYLKDANTLLLVPCNVVIEEKNPELCQIKAIKPSAMVGTLQTDEMTQMAKSVDAILARALEKA
jgi:uncharacterized protein (DUF302 family)